MFSRNRMKGFTASCSGQIEQLKQALETADAVLIGAGSGLSTSAGLIYSGERFERYFSDFHQKYGITDIYSGGFYPFDTLEEYWAWWSRHIFYNRYVDAPLPVYQVLLALVKDKDYFVLTTNVDHCFQKAGKPDSLRKTLGSKKFFFRLRRRCKTSLRIHHTLPAGMSSAAGHLHTM